MAKQEITVAPIRYMSRVAAGKPGPATLPTKVEFVAWGSRALRVRPDASGLRARQVSALYRPERVAETDRTTHGLDE